MRSTLAQAIQDAVPVSMKRDEVAEFLTKQMQGQSSTTQYDKILSYGQADWAQLDESARAKSTEELRLLDQLLQTLTQRKKHALELLRSQYDQQNQEMQRLQVLRRSLTSRNELAERSKIAPSTTAAAAAASSTSTASTTTSKTKAAMQHKVVFPSSSSALAPPPASIKRKVDDEQPPPQKKRQLKQAPGLHRAPQEIIQLPPAKPAEPLASELLSAVAVTALDPLDPTLGDYDPFTSTLLPYQS